MVSPLASLLSLVPVAGLSTSPRPAADGAIPADFLALLAPVGDATTMPMAGDPARPPLAAPGNDVPLAMPSPPILLYPASEVVAPSMAPPTGAPPIPSALIDPLDVLARPSSRPIAASASIGAIATAIAIAPDPVEVDAAQPPATVPSLPTGVRTPSLAIERKDRTPFTKASRERAPAAGQEPGDEADPAGRSDAPASSSSPTAPLPSPSLVPTGGSPALVSIPAAAVAMAPAAPAATTPAEDVSAPTVRTGRAGTDASSATATATPNRADALVATPASSPPTRPDARPPLGGSTAAPWRPTIAAGDTTDAPPAPTRGGPPSTAATSVVSPAIESNQPSVTRQPADATITIPVAIESNGPPPIARAQAPTQLPQTSTPAAIVTVPGSPVPRGIEAAPIALAAPTTVAAQPGPRPSRPIAATTRTVYGHVDRSPAPAPPSVTARELPLAVAPVAWSGAPVAIAISPPAASTTVLAPATSVPTLAATPPATPIAIPVSLAPADPAPADLASPVAPRPDAAPPMPTTPTDAPADGTDQPAADTPPARPRSEPAFRAFAAAMFDAGRDPAAVAVPIAAAPSSSATAQPPLDLTQPRWPHAMVDRIERLRDEANAGDTRIRLIPDALGAIDVAVRREGETVHVAFNAERAETRQLLAEARPELTALAETRGIRIAEPATTTGGGWTGAQPQNQPQSGQAFAGNERAPHRQPPASTPAAPSRAANAADDEGDDTRIA